MQRRLDATVTHLITVETTGVRERQVCHTQVKTVDMQVDSRTAVI